MKMASAGYFVFSSRCLLVAIICAITLQATNGASLAGEIDTMNAIEITVLRTTRPRLLKRDLENISNDVNNLNKTNETDSPQTTKEAVTESTEHNGKIE